MDGTEHPHRTPHLKAKKLDLFFFQNASSAIPNHLSSGHHRLVQAPVISCQDNHISLSSSVGLLLHPLLPPTVCSLHSNQRGILKGLQIWSLTHSVEAFTGLLSHLEGNPSFSQPSGLLFLSLYLKPLSACSPHPSCSRSSLPDSLQTQGFCTRCVLPRSCSAWLLMGSLTHS